MRRIPGRSETVEELLETHKSGSKLTNKWPGTFFPHAGGAALSISAVRRDGTERRSVRVQRGGRARPAGRLQAVLAKEPTSNGFSAARPLPSRMSLYRV
jgi:hypothetical protein